MAECGWKGPFDTPCHFTAGHGSAHSQMGGSEDDRYGNERRHRTHSIFDRPGPRDTRSKDQKLEAIIDPKSGATEGERENAKHLLFKRRQSGKSSPSAREQAQAKSRNPDSWEWAQAHGFSREAYERRRARARGDDIYDEEDEDTVRNMSHTDFMNWLRRKQRQREPKALGKGSK